MSSETSPTTGLTAGTPLFTTVSLGGLDIAVAEPEKAASRICEAALATSKARATSGHAIHLINAYTISLARKDKKYADVLHADDANLPDGRPLSWISRLKKTPVSQVRGPSLFGSVMDMGRATNLRHFLLGATDETLQMLRNELLLRYPGVNIVGQFSPPFRDATSEEIAEQDRLIRELAPHIVWVGLGTPKQDFEVHRLSLEMPLTAIAVGAAFDFVAGSKKEAPGWMTKFGIEWLYRLLSEPRRLWRRYLFGNLEFIWAMLRTHKS